MKPVSFTRKGSDIFYHYSFSDLRKWISRGNQDGDVGAILVREHHMKQGTYLVYKCYGTIENPFTVRKTVQMAHHPIFDGKLCTPEERINSIVQEALFKNYKMVFIDLSDE